MGVAREYEVRRLVQDECAKYINDDKHHKIVTPGQKLIALGATINKLGTIISHQRRTIRAQRETIRGLELAISKDPDYLRIFEQNRGQMAEFIKAFVECKIPEPPEPKETT